jgi:hypothetical protein
MSFMKSVKPTESKSYYARCGSGAKSRSLSLVLALVLITLSGVAASVSSSRADGDSGWVKLPLQHGRIGSDTWVAGALVPKQASSHKFCVKLGLTSSTEENGVFPGEESTECGLLLEPARPVSGSVSAGSGSARITIIERLYDPSVRTATVHLGDGSRKDFRLRAVRGISPGGRGAPRFRYLVLPVPTRTCVRSVITHDLVGRIVAHEPGQGCPA